MCYFQGAADLYCPFLQRSVPSGQGGCSKVWRAQTENIQRGIDGTLALPEGVVMGAFYALSPFFNSAHRACRTGSRLKGFYPDPNVYSKDQQPLAIMRMAQGIINLQPVWDSSALL